MIYRSINVTSLIEHPQTTAVTGGASVCVTLRTSVELDPVLRGCFKRACTWAVPPNWSTADWFEELRALQAATACLSEREYDCSFDVPLCAFVYHRVMARSLARYRQEWCYGSRFISGMGVELTEGTLGEVVSDGDEAAALHRLDFEPLGEALNRLPQADRRLVEQLFWDGRKEHEIAGTLGISQQAVNLRKRGILRRLRTCLEPAERTT